MDNRNIGIVILATNAYFVLGLRFIKKFTHHYRGDSNIKFHFFSDCDPHPYLSDSDSLLVEYHKTSHESWIEGVGSKFINIISLENTDNEYLFYFDADTNIQKDFIEDWFIGDLVGLEHFGNNGWMLENKGYERNPISKCYIPFDTGLFQMYYHSCLFGGKKSRLIEMCKKLLADQTEDRKIHFEPGVNDESYVNHYFHYNPPTYSILVEDYQFTVSCKGGLGETRNPSLSVERYTSEIIKRRESIFELSQDGILSFIN